MPVDLELWNKLKDFQLDDPRAAFRFTDRLAQENGWSKAHARRAVDEYKKFIYLAATSPTPVTPSDVVDQVWHLHLTFTRSYWDEMCADLLGRTLHHGPTKGGKSEVAKYRNQYAETLALYHQEFGTEPPNEFWPSAEARFAGTVHQRWVDARTHFIIRKPRWPALWGGAIALTGALTATSATAADGSAGGNAAAAIVIGGVAAAALLLLGLFAGSGTRRRGKAGRGGDDGSSSYIPFVGSSHGGKHTSGGEGGEGGEGGGGEGGGGGDGGSGCGGGGGCGSS